MLREQRKCAGEQEEEGRKHLEQGPGPGGLRGGAAFLIPPVLGQGCGPSGQPAPAPPIVFFEAKDLLQAAQCHLLEKDSPHVTADLKKIAKGKKLSPVLLVRGQARVGVPLIIADGHHRICASWYWQEDEPVACCIATVPR